MVLQLVLGVVLLKGTPPAAMALAAPGLTVSKETEVVLLTPMGEKAKAEEVLAEVEGKTFLEGVSELKSPYFAIVNHPGRLLLVSRSWREFADVALLPKALSSFDRLPAGETFGFPALPEPAQKYVAEKLAAMLPYHQRIDAQPRPIALMPRPSLTLVLESRGEQVTLQIADPSLGGLTKQQLAARYEPMESNPLPLRFSEPEIKARIAAEAVDGGFGIRFAVLSRPRTERPISQAVADALSDYRAALKACQEAAALAAGPLERALSQRYPEMVGPFATNKEFSSFRPEEQEALRSLLQSNRRLGLSGPADINSFLRSARVASATPGLTLGLMAGPDGGVYGIRIWPR